MKKIINYEKDILFKTNIGEICSISLEHDFTVDDDVLVGEFIISGEYKPNRLSLNKESFNYQLPLEYELEDTVDLSTLSYDIDNFEYNIKDDELSVYIDFGIRYEELKQEPSIPEMEEESDEGWDDIELPSFIKEVDENAYEENNRTSNEAEKDEEDNETEPTIEEMTEERFDDEDKEMILETAMEIDEYITYRVHIVREGDTLDSIAKEYNTTVEVIKEYNSTEALEIKSKLIIPLEKDE